MIKQIVIQHNTLLSAIFLNIIFILFFLLDHLNRNLQKLTEIESFKNEISDDIKNDLECYICNDLIIEVNIYLYDFKLMFQNYYTIFVY